MNKMSNQQFTALIDYIDKRIALESESCDQGSSFYDSERHDLKQAALDSANTGLPTFADVKIFGEDDPTMDDLDSIGIK